TEPPEKAVSSSQHRTEVPHLCGERRRPKFGMRCDCLFHHDQAGVCEPSRPVDATMCCQHLGKLGRFTGQVGDMIEHLGERASDPGICWLSQTNAMGDC